MLIRVIGFFNSFVMSVIVVMAHITGLVHPKHVIHHVSIMADRRVEDHGPTVFTQLVS